MSREIPALPEGFSDLAADIRAELLDYDCVNREHGTRSCYTGGCKGPLCLRADRIFHRQRYLRKRIEAGKPYEPSDLRRDTRDDELDAALVLYHANRKLIEIVVRLEDLYADIKRAI